MQGTRWIGIGLSILPSDDTPTAEQLLFCLVVSNKMVVMRNCGMGITLTTGNLCTWNQYDNRYWTKRAETRMWQCQALCGTFTLELQRLSDGILSWPPFYPSLVVMLRMLAVLPPLISYVLIKRRNTDVSVLLSGVFNRTFIQLPYHSNQATTEFLCNVKWSCRCA